MMKFERLPRHVRSQRVICIRKFGQGECHWCLLNVKPNGAGYGGETAEKRE
jgi:hypothetical protein